MAESLNLSARETAKAVRDGAVTAEEVVQGYLDHIAGVEDTVKAWAHLDPEMALAEAREADKHRRLGRPVGPLHGVPVGVKDIIDVQGYPCEYGSPLHAGRRPGDDASVVARLRQAGAIIMGKTVTTEYAVYHPNKTTNPHDPERTPGGSSSGSAAAVAANMVPLSLGTQTNGSVVRPAAYCGVVGYKPTFGLISRHRVLRQSRPLDHIGIFGRDIEDVALCGDILIGVDGLDPDTGPRSHPALGQVVTQEPPMPPRFAFIKGPGWDVAEESTREAFGELREFLGDRAEDVPLDEVFNEVIDWHRLVMEADLAKNLGGDYRRGKEQFSDALSQMMERGGQVRAVDYNLGLERRDMFALSLAELLEDFDAIISPATTGVAPKGLDYTGNPVFCTMATFCGTPSLSLPLMQDEAGLPLGVQLIGNRHDDARLLRTARWLVNKVKDDQS